MRLLKALDVPALILLQTVLTHAVLTHAVLTHAVLLPALLIQAVGCSAEAGADYGSEENAATVALDLTDGNGDPYKKWAVVTDRDGVGATAVDDPGMCFSASGFVVFQRDSSNKFKSVTWDSSGVPTPGVVNPRASKWSTWGGTRTFKSKPSCANLDAVDSQGTRTYKIVLSGVDSADKLYTSAAQANKSPDGSAPDVPSILTTWDKVSDRTFASGPGITVGNGQVVIVGRGKSDSRIYAYTRPMPYEDGSWSSSVKAPALPSGWSAQGSPTIAYTLAGMNKFTVMVRAQNATFSLAYFRAHFDGSAWVSSAGTVWAQVPAWSTIAGDPALEFSTDVNELTLFSFQGSRAGAYPVQMTGLDLWWDVVRSIRGTELVDVFGGPAVHGYSGVAEGEGLHRIVARKADGSMYFSETPLVVLFP